MLFIFLGFCAAKGIAQDEIEYLQSCDSNQKVRKGRLEFLSPITASAPLRSTLAVVDYKQAVSGHVNDR
jgi:hypothetical protein